MAIGAAFRNQYTGNNSTGTYTYGFKIFDAGDLRLIVTDSNGNETVLTLGTHYSVTGAGLQAGGTIVLVAGFGWMTGANLSTGYTLSIERNMPFEQATDLRNQSSFYPEVHEDTFDTLAMLIQRCKSLLDRCVRIQEGIVAGNYNTVLPLPAADKVIGWNSAGTALENKPAAAVSFTGDDSNITFLQSGSGAVTRSTRSKLRDFPVSMEDFGAAGDGVTDDRPALVNALAASNIVELVRGRTYYISTAVPVSSNKTIRVAGGQGTAYLKGASGQTILAPATSSADVEYVAIQGISFIGAGAHAIKASSLAHYMSTWNIRDCHFSAELVDCIYGNLLLCDIRFNVFGLFGTPNANHRHIYTKGSLAGKASNQNYILFNRFYHAQGAEALHFDSGYQLHFIGNNVEQNDASTSLVIKGMYGVTLHYNWFEQNAGPYQCALANDDLAVNGNYIVDVRWNWFDLSHAGNTHVFSLAGATTNVDLVNNSGVMSNTQYMTGYGGSNDDVGIRTSFGNRMVGTYTGITRHYGLGAVQASSVAAAGKARIGSLTLGALRFEILCPANDGLRIRDADNSDRIAAQLLADANHLGVLELFNAAESRRLYFNGNGLGAMNDSGEASIDDKAILALSSTTRAFVPPRMTTAERDAISSPATASIIFNTTAGRHEIYTGAAWVTIGSFRSGTTAAIASGTAVTHGLGGTPSQVIVTAADAGPEDVYTSNKGATSFVIHYGGGGTHVFDWIALV